MRSLLWGQGKYLDGPTNCACVTASRRDAQGGAVMNSVAI
jgi:hypothetical protein